MSGNEVLSLGVGAKILSLNLNSYIHDKESPIYFASLSHFAEPVSYTFCNDTGISNLLYFLVLCSLQERIPSKQNSLIRYA